MSCIAHIRGHLNDCNVEDLQFLQDLDDVFEAVTKEDILNVSKDEWKRTFGVVTPGGAPAWERPFCGNGKHVMGVEHARNYTEVCNNCGAKLYYPGIKGVEVSN